MIKIVLLVITVLLSAVIIVLGFAPYLNDDDVYCRIYIAVAINIIFNIMVLGVVLNGLT